MGDVGPVETAEITGVMGDRLTVMEAVLVLPAESVAVAVRVLPPTLSGTVADQCA